MRTPEELLCSRWWRIRHSSWLLWGLLSFGILWAVGFAYVGIRARNVLGLIGAAVSLAWTVTYFVITGLIDLPAKGEPSTPASSTLGGLLVLFWAGGAVLGWFVNRKWLVWLAHHGRRGPWYATATANQQPSVSAPAPAPADIDRAFATAAPRTASPLNPPAPGTTYLPQVAPQPPAPLDLNLASAVQLEQLPGIDRAWANHIVIVRERTGRFNDPADLITRASVQPHVFAGLRERVTVTSTPQPGARSANQPPSPPPPADGRRLEF